MTRLIAYAENRGPCTHHAFEHYLSQLPDQHKAQVLKYKFPKDAQACLYGKLLLQQGLKELGIPGLGLDDIKYTDHQRPYFDSPHIDFNISHSDRYVVCAIASDIRVGIDIEQIAEVDVSEFFDQFSGSEIDFMRQGDSLVNFYSLWTRKEAVIKADGKGLSIPLHQLVVTDKSTMLEGRRWFLTEINIAEGYPCHLCTDIEITEPVPVRKYTF